jgi:hypothetical protein
VALNHDQLADGSRESKENKALVMDGSRQGEGMCC